MRLLRSGEAAEGETVDLRTLAALARDWYGDRLDRAWRPRSAEELARGDLDFYLRPFRDAKQQPEPLIEFALGWLALIAAPQLVRALDVVPVALFVAGGLLYSAGAVVYARRRPDPWPRTFGFHEVFHALVILAAAAHYVALIGWVVPAAS